MLRRAVTVAVLAAATLLPAAQAHAGTDPDYHRPAVGECRDMGWADLSQDADPEPTVDCSARHTARTVGVVSVPADLDYSDSARVLDIAVSKCAPAAAEALGRDALVRVRTAYNYGFFMPTRAEWSHGARWMRCDLILLAGTKLAPLPTDDEPALPKGGLPDAVARCLVGKDHVTTTCSRAHQWRAAGAFVLRQKRFPDDDASYRRILHRCDDLVRTRAYRWTYGSETIWKHGHHEVVCYAKTRR